ncbi:CHAT domain-containing protein [Oscillatoria amoena NRMC-F 0135]|nr:CHAT domain-containing protein [Oscillatoria amoena NRMC-F 0135]
MEKDYKRSKQRIEQALTNYQDFIKKYFPALSEREKAKYWNTIKGDFEFYNTLALGRLEDFKDLSDQVYNYQLLTKALLLSSSIKIRERIMSSNNEELITSFNTWVEKKELLTLALSMSPTQLAENEIDPAALNYEVERLERSLSQQSELFGQSFDNKKITFDDVKKSLKPNEVAIEMVRFRYFNHSFTDSIIYAALYIKSDMSKPKAIINGNGARMEGRSYRLYRNSMDNQIEDLASYKTYWEPIQKELGQVSTIYLSADGVYNQITLDALEIADGKFVLDNSNIVYVSNTKDLYLRKVKSAAKPDNKASMFGNPTFYLTASRVNAPITQLPGTEREINQLQFLLKQKGWITEEYIEKTATEEQIKELNSPKVLHVATHGFYKSTTEVSAEDEMEGNEAQLAQNPLMRNGLLLRGAGDLLDKTDYNYNMENGILTAYEAMNLNLDKTDLVVLSACETGLGELQAGEGVFGLQRAFLVAGAKVLIMSMFKVDDEATQRLMLKFYQKWLNSNNMRQSFTEAKKELRADYPEPIYWGSFMMIGLD